MPPKSGLVVLADQPLCGAGALTPALEFGQVKASSLSMCMGLKSPISNILEIYFLIWFEHGKLYQF
mgnify:CR=1 FL=1